MNYFEFHGSNIYDEKRSILEKAEWKGFNIKRHEILSDGSFIISDYISPTVFVFENKIYSFITGWTAAISDFFELNMSKENCLTGKNGVYYELQKNE
jgi:hypothetical protein